MPVTNENRRFTIGYNALPPEQYLEIIKPYRKNISSVFFGLPSVINNHQINSRYLGTITADRECARREQNTFRFLEKTKGSGLPRYLCVNATYYQMSDSEAEAAVAFRIAPVIRNFAIEGVVVADFVMARAIRRLMPDIEIQGSCNSNEWTIREMQQWRDTIGVSVFNPPREILRMPTLLKEMHAAGFKMKCLVNEGCLFGCPMRYQHDLTMNLSPQAMRHYCADQPLSDFFRENWVLPRHLKLLDPYVHDFKIGGRLLTPQHLTMALDAYINERDDVDAVDIVYNAGADLYRKKKIKVPVAQIPEKIFSCECKKCGTCKVCPSLVKKFAKASGISLEKERI